MATLGFVAYTRSQARVPADVQDELARASSRATVPSLTRRLGEAMRAYEAERYRDAERLLAPLARSLPTVGAVRELFGLTLYGLGRWRRARTELEAAHLLTGSYDQHPVLADCDRALGRDRAVAQRWQDLRQASPAPAVLAEGRIVMAGSLADQGKLNEAIALLAPAAKRTPRVRPDQLRTWYVLADLYERIGDVPRSRELLERIAEHDVTFYDVSTRLAAL